jgi:tetratricopeptide (TPR) repeat protein
MSRKSRTTTGIILVALLMPCAAGFAEVSAGQGSGHGQGQQAPPKPAAPPAQPGQAAVVPADTAPPVSAEESSAYKAFQDVKNSETERKIQLGEEFLKKYPQSRYAQDVYAYLTNAYWMSGQAEKMFAAGEKTLELNADNVDVLAAMAAVLPRSVNPSSLDAAQKLDKAEKYGKRCLDVLVTVSKPAGMSDEDFAKAKNEKLSMCHSGLGVTNYHRQKYADSATELEQAVKLTSMPDPVDYFVLGLAQLQIKHFGDAVVAFSHCGEAGGPMQDRCKASLENAKKLAATQPSAPKP